MGRGVGSRIEARARREELQQKLVMREMGQEREKKRKRGRTTLNNSRELESG